MVKERTADNIKTEAGFEKVFKTHFKSLYAYERTMLNDPDNAEEVVQHVFFKLWEKREDLIIQETIRGYLYRPVYNTSMNHLKHAKIKAAHAQEAAAQIASDNSVVESLEAQELENRLRSALAQLPERCRTVFQLCRFEEMKYKEVAEQLNLPPKTVENEMGKALRLLRLSFSDLLPIILITFYLLWKP